jgi:hypothetical protein
VCVFNLSLCLQWYESDYVSDCGQKIDVGRKLEEEQQIIKAWCRVFYSLQNGLYLGGIVGCDLYASPVENCSVAILPSVRLRHPHLRHPLAEDVSIGTTNPAHLQPPRSRHTTNMPQQQRQSALKNIPRVVIWPTWENVVATSYLFKVRLPPK